MRDADEEQGLVGDEVGVDTISVEFVAMVGSGVVDMGRGRVIVVISCCSFSNC